MIMNQDSERRTHRRLNMRLPLEYRVAQARHAKSCSSTTMNVSTGGLYFETTDPALKPGDDIAFELGIPAEDRRFPQHGTIATQGTILRTTPVEHQTHENGIGFPRYGVAARFSQGFKLAL